MRGAEAAVSEERARHEKAVRELEKWAAAAEAAQTHAEREALQAAAALADAQVTVNS